MKRRGFLGALFGAPAIPVAAAIAEKFPKGLLRESEPAVVEVEKSLHALDQGDWANCCTVVVGKWPTT